MAERVLPRRAIHRLQNNSSMRIDTVYDFFLVNFLFLGSALKGKLGDFFLLAQSFFRPKTKTSFNRQFSPKQPEVGQIFILRSNFDQNKDHMTSKQVRGSSKN